VKKKGGDDCNGIGIVGKGYGNAVDKDWDQSSTSGAGQDHVDKFVSRGCFLRNIGKDLATYDSVKMRVVHHSIRAKVERLTVQESIAKQAHVFDFICVE
jgi:hypothetical protein